MIGSVSGVCMVCGVCRIVGSILNLSKRMMTHYKVMNVLANTLVFSLRELGRGKWLWVELCGAHPDGRQLSH